MNVRISHHNSADVEIACSALALVQQTAMLNTHKQGSVFLQAAAASEGLDSSASGVAGSVIGMLKTLSTERGAVINAQLDAANAGLRMALCSPCEHMAEAGSYRQRSFRCGINYKQVLLPQPMTRQAMSPGMYRWEAVPKGALSNLVPVGLPHAASVLTGVATCDEGTMLLSVKAVGINFRDVLNVLGMYPGG